MMSAPEPRKSANVPVGPWLRFEREREIEEEVIILATPRIVTPMAADGS
jgi:hypothetical protein